MHMKTSICESDILEGREEKINLLMPPQLATPAQNYSQFDSYDHNLPTETKGVLTNGM